MRRTLVVLVALTILVAAYPVAAASPGARRVEVMTRNLYVGADIFRVFDAATPADLPIVVAGILGTVMDTDFTERAEALADEVARYRPHLIGLQEVSLIRTQVPGDFLIGNPTPATFVLYDYLAILQAALAARGLDYRVAGEVENADVELPFVFDPTGPVLGDVRLTDHDVILARHDVPTSDEVERNYAVFFQVPFGGGTIDFLRGFVAVDAEVLGRSFRFVNTHLEVESIVPAIQQAQAAELLNELAGETLPTIVVGDLNSAPDDALPAPYGQLVAAGFVDAWTRRLGKPEPGETCCFDEDLDDPTEQLTSRIDLVFVRTGATVPPWDEVGPVKSTVVGDELRDRTPSGLWPSDHGGVVTSIAVPPVSFEPVDRRPLRRRP